MHLLFWLAGPVVCGAGVRITNYCLASSREVCPLSRHNRSREPTLNGDESAERPEPLGQMYDDLTRSYFFKSAGQFVTNWSGAWDPSSVWFTSRRLPSEETSNNTPIAAKGV